MVFVVHDSPVILPFIIVMCYEIGKVGAHFDVSTSSKGDAVASDYIIGQCQLVSQHCVLIACVALQLWLAGWNAVS
jgi:hypothetical protein